MMLVTERLGATLFVGVELLHRPGALEGIAKQLTRAVQAEADKYAWKVRPESVHIRQVDAREDTHDVRFEAVWSPKEARFVGGEYDGDTITVSRESDGLPLLFLRLPYRSHPSSASNDDRPSPTTSSPTYERSGIDPIEDVWVYTLRGARP